MYKIGELSKLSRLPVKTLRYYGQEGLLVPDYIDEETGYRYYNAGKLSDCYRIIMLKGLGFSLGEIKELLSLPKENFSRLIQAKEDELLRLKAQTEERLHLLRTFNLTVKENASMFDIIIRKSDNIRLAYRRTIVSRKEEYGTLLAEMRRLEAAPSSLTTKRNSSVRISTRASGWKSPESFQRRVACVRKRFLFQGTRPVWSAATRPVKRESGRSTNMSWIMITRLPGPS